MNDQDLTKTDYDPDRSLVLIEGLSHFLTNFLQNLASCQTSLNLTSLFALFVFLLCRLASGAFTIDSSTPTLRIKLNEQHLIC
jgi:hypothetical protein